MRIGTVKNHFVPLAIELVLEVKVGIVTQFLVVFGIIAPVMPHKKPLSIGLIVVYKFPWLAGFRTKVSGYGHEVLLIESNVHSRFSAVVPGRTHFAIVLVEHIGKG